MPSVLFCFWMTLLPPLWDRWIAMPRIKKWDLHNASSAEKELAKAANIEAGWPIWQDIKF